MFCSIQEYMQHSDVPRETPHVERPPVQSSAGKLIDNPEALPVFTIENVVDYLISRKENDCMRAEDWKVLKQVGINYSKKATCRR